MRLELTKKKPFKYVDFLTIGQYTISPITSYFDTDNRFLEQVIEVDEDESNGQVWKFINEDFIDCQLCSLDDEEIYLQGKDVLEYFDLINFDDMGNLYSMNLKKQFKG